MKLLGLRNAVIMKKIKFYFCRFWLVFVLASTGLALQAKEGSSALEMARQLNQAFIEVADNVSPAVVVVKIAHKPDYVELDEDNPLWELIPRQFRRQLEEQFEKRRQKRPAQQEPQYDGQGSGVVIRENGYILTNRHVVEGADKIKVRFKDGREFDAQVRGVDPQSDIAVLKIDAENLTVAKLGDSSKTRVGEFAIAIGAPFELDYSVTFGHVSAKGRSHVIPSFGESSPGAWMDQDFIQTDASINPGNSGGPLVNIDGEVIGLNTLIRGLHTGIGFAIPSNLAKEVAEKLISDGKFTRAWLGVGIIALKDYADRDLFKGVKDGVVVYRIDPSGPAAKSDLKASDVITSVDSQPVASAQELRSQVRSKKIGGTVLLEVVRGGKNMQIKVQTAEWPEEIVGLARTGKSQSEPDSRGFGLTVQALTSEMAEKYGVEKTEGVIVTAVEPGSPADQKRIKPGDIITEVNQTSVSNPKQFRDALKDADARKGVIINLISEGASKFEVLKDGGD